MGGSHRCLKGGIFWEGGPVSHGSVAHSCEKKGRVDSRSVAILGGRGRLGGSHIDLIYLKGGGCIFCEGGTISEGRI